MRAYWFGERLGYGDGRIPEVGITHEVEGTPILCEHGLHASAHPFDALKYAFCSKLWLVELDGKIIQGEDKAVATRRTYLACIDAEQLLWSAARRRALSVIHIWDCPPAMREYLETGREDIRAAARNAAEASARSAAEAAARSAAEAAAWAAAEAAARAAARAAAWDAAEASAWAAARDAARDAAEDAARAAAWAAARNAAWDVWAAAAWDAAWDAARDEILQMVEEAFNESAGQ